jgi:hypothetical protein
MGGHKDSKNRQDTLSFHHFLLNTMKYIQIDTTFRLFTKFSAFAYTYSLVYGINSIMFKELVNLYFQHSDKTFGFSIRHDGSAIFLGFTREARQTAGKPNNFNY